MLTAVTSDSTDEHAETKSGQFQAAGDIVRFLESGGGAVQSQFFHDGCLAT